MPDPAFDEVDFWRYENHLKAILRAAPFHRAKRSCVDHNCRRLEYPNLSGAAADS